jgi:hypothetical protein
MILEQLGVADVATQRIEIDVIPAAALALVIAVRGLSARLAYRLQAVS